MYVSIIFYLGISSIRDGEKNKYFPLLANDMIIRSFLKTFMRQNLWEVDIMFIK